MKSITRNEFKKICRLCLTHHRKLKSISTNSIITMIEECAPVQVTIGDDFPQLICQECFELLEKIILFRRKCVESETKLYQACKEDRIKTVSLENKIDNSSRLEPKIEPIVNESCNTIKEAMIGVPIKTEEECPIFKNEDHRGKDAIDSDPDLNLLPDIEYSDSDSEPLINYTSKAESNQIDTKKKRKRQYYECEYKCGKVIGSFRGYEDHLRCKHKAKVKKCQSCPKKFYSEIFLQKHSDKHIGLTCSYCQKVFEQQKSFDEHLLTHGVLKPYTCSECDGTFQNKTYLKTHIKRAHSHSVPHVECPVCYKKMLKHSFDRHMKLHDGRKIFNCPHCVKTFSYKETLRKHQKIVHQHQPIVTKFLCDLCGAPNRNKSSLVAHLKVHSSEKPHKCLQCTKSYKTPCELKVHIRNIHLNIRSHVCSVCGLGFFTARILNNHKRTHTGEKPFICEICETAFSFKAGLYLHMKAHHNTPKPVKNLNIHFRNIHSGSVSRVECPVCHKKLFKRCLNTHVKLHNERDIFKCPDCVKTFHYLQTLKKHRRIVHEMQPEVKKYLCDLCGAANKNQSSLARHLKVHSAEKAHKCSECNKSYKTACQLKVHIRNIHLNIRKHVCSICGLGFFNSIILNNHIRTHTGEKPFICEICQAAFSFKAGLYLHMKSRHNIPQPVKLPKFDLNGTQDQSS